MKILRSLLLVAGLAAMAFGSWKLWGIYRLYSQSGSEYESLKNYVAEVASTDSSKSQAEIITNPTEPKASAEPAESSTTGRPSHVPMSFPEVDFAALREMNPDVVGWIVAEDTPINYPITQAEDNQYYLEHIFSGEANGTGCIFLDSANSPDFTDDNSVIYGHHMKNGSMFASLVNYKTAGYYESHPYMLLMTPKANYVVTIFAGFVVSGWGDAWTVAFPNEEKFGEWIQRAKNESMFRTDVNPTTQDRIITLSTCTYEFDDARFVLMGILEPCDSLPE